MSLEHLVGSVGGLCNLDLQVVSPSPTLGAEIT